MLNIRIAVFVPQSDQIVQASIRNSFDIDVDRMVRQVKVRSSEHVDTIAFDRKSLEGRLSTRGKTPGNGKSLIERRFWSAAVDATCGCRQVLRRVAQ